MIGLKDAIGEVVKTVAGPLLRLIPDPNARKEAEERFNSDLLNALTGLVQGQLAINKQEAAHPSVFVAGWRPFVGWTCGIGLAWAFVVRPFAIFLAVTFMDNPPEFPELNVGELMTLLLGMLGLGGLRTIEKQTGTARQTWRQQDDSNT